MNGDGIELAVALQAELRRVVDDPASDPAEVEEAKVKLAIIGDGLTRIAAARSPKRQTELRAKWIALIVAHRATGKPRPKLIEVAENMGWNSEQPLRDYCRELGVADWHDVHPIVAAARV